MIRIEVEPYCQQCLDFSPDVTKPERVDIKNMKGDTTEIYSDTIVQCKYRKRCAGITRFLTQQIKGENKQ